MTLRTIKTRGSVILGVILVCVIFIIMIVPIISWTANEYSWSMRSYMRLRALNLADAGAENAIWEIFYNGASFASWGGTNPKTLTLYSFKDGNNTTLGDIEIETFALSANTYLITATGYVPSKAQQKVKKTIKVNVKPHMLFDNAVFGSNSVSVGGNANIDSYDSSLNPYSPLNAEDNGDVGSNGQLSVSGSGYVSGDIFVGPDGTVSGDDSSHVSGETIYSGEEVELSPVGLPDYFTAIPSLGTLNLSSKDELVLLPGNYRYDSISLGSKSILTLSGPASIYVEGNFSITAQAQVIITPSVDIYIGGSGTFTGRGFVNTSALPDNLNLYGLGNGTAFTFSGTSDFYGTLYAPDSSIFMSGNSAFFGAIVGKDVSMTGSMEFHYDEALSDTGPSSGYDIVYWQED